MPTLATPRLILRPPVEADLDGFAAMAADADAMRFLGGTLPRAAAWRQLAQFAGSWALHGFGMFSVIEASSGAWIGRIGPWRPEGWPGSEVGWGLLSSAWGHGYATEAATACMDFAFDRLGWTEVIHTIEPQNLPSIAVARRLGSRLLRPCRLPAPLNLDLDAWGQSREDWRARPR